MSKTASSLELTLNERPAHVTLTHWLREELKRAILEHRLRPGTRLPATRDFARQYGLSRGTIVNAFDQLKSEGYVEGSVGSGTYVRPVLPDELLQVPREAGPKPQTQRKQRRSISNYGRRVNLFPAFEIRPS